MNNSAILLISCPDAKGIVAAVSNFIFTHNGNILHADEHLDSESNTFFLRVEWDMHDFDLTTSAFSKSFTAIATKFSMQWKVSYTSQKQKIAILVSKEDHCLADLLYRYKTNELSCEIPLVISNHADAKELVDFYKLPFYQIPINTENKGNAEEMMLELFKKHKVDLIVLTRYMQILSSKIISEYPERIINIHHSFLPAFVGAKPYHQAHSKGVKIIGATAHYVTEDLDQGPIIEQDILRVTHKDSVEELVQKGKDIEKVVLSRAVKWHLQHKVLVYKNKTVVFS